MIDDDTIAAIATAAGVGGVGIVRISGPRAVEIGAALTCRSLDRQVRVGWVTRVDGARVDQVLAFAMRAPASFTGEDVVELQGHGGEQNLAALLAAVVERGGRVAEPGEFTRRAVANGKLDLTRAEALLEVIHAGSERAWRNAQTNLGGALGAAAAALETRALQVLAELEGGIDFPEADLDAKAAPWIAAELAHGASACAALAAGFRSAEATQRGIVVALVGAVNAGKSSLLNALVGRERAIVAPEPGTTRDFLEVPTTWNGVAVTLLDTAGLRETSDAIEQRGITLGSARAASADVILELTPATSSDESTRRVDRSDDLLSEIRTRGVSGHAARADPSPDEFGGGGTSSDEVAGRRLRVLSKCDLLPALPGSQISPSLTSQSGDVVARRPAGRTGLSGAALLAGDASGGDLGARRPAGRTGASGGDLVAERPASRTGLSGGELVAGGAGARELRVSAVTGEGLEELKQRVLAAAGIAEREGSESAIVTTERQHAVVVAARDAFVAAGAAFHAGLAPELVAVDLREAVRALAQLRGVEVGERVLDELFARFCIGK